MNFPLLNRNSDTQEGRGNGGGVLVRAFVLAVEQNFELLLQIVGFSVLFRSFERIHGRSVIFSEFTDEFRWLAWKVEYIGISDKRYILFWNSHGSKDADDEIKGIILQLVQIGCIAFLKLAIREAMLLRTLVAGRNQIVRDIDAQHVRSKSRLRQCR